MEDWGMVKSPDKILSTQKRGKECQGGCDRRNAWGLKESIWERWAAEDGWYPRARGAEWWNPKPKPRPAATAGGPGSKAGASPFLTNRGRWDRRGSQWAGPSCPPDVYCRTAGGLSSGPAAADPQGRRGEREEGVGGGKGSGIVPHCLRSAGSQIAFTCVTEAGSHPPRGGAVF